MSIDKKGAKRAPARASGSREGASPPEKSPADADEHVVAWAQREFQQGRRPEWTPIELIAAMDGLRVGNRAPLANYVRAHGMPPLPRGVVAGLIDPQGSPTRMQARTAAILEAVAALRRLYAQELKHAAADPAFRPHFASVQAILEAVAETYLGSAEQWRTVERLELRHKQ